MVKTILFQEWIAALVIGNEFLACTQVMNEDDKMKEVDNWVMKEDDLNKKNVPLNNL